MQAARLGTARSKFTPTLSEWSPLGAAEHAAGSLGNSQALVAAPESKRHRRKTDAVLSVMRAASSVCTHTSWRIMKKPKHEVELFKAALLAGIRYAEGRGAVEFEATDSASAKALYVYRLLVHDKIIVPMPEHQVSERTIRHRLATWYAHLPKGHPLL
jgi:Domain of unknown function (DUF5062)